MFRCRMDALGAAVGGCRSGLSQADCYDRAGIIYHNLTDDSELLDALPRRARMDIPGLLKEDSGGIPRTPGSSMC